MSFASPEREHQPPTFRRRQRRLALWTAPPALLALAVAAKLLSVGMLGDSAADAYESGKEEGVAAAASLLQLVNVVEPYKAHFTSGDAAVLAGDFTAARKEFEAALQAGSGLDECKVRVNLVLSVEKLGDATATAGDQSEAATLFGEALEITGSSPAQCREEGPGNSAGEGDRLGAATDRLKAKIAAGSPGDGAEKQQDQDAPPTQQPDQLQKLGESAQKAQRERAEGQEREEYLRGPDNGPGVDRPW